MSAAAQTLRFTEPLPRSAAMLEPSREWGPRFAFLCLCLAALGFIAGFGTAVTLLTTAGFLAALAGIWRPVLGLLGVGLLSTIDPLTRVYLMSGGLFRWNTFNYVLLLMMLIFYQQVLQFRDRATILLIGLLALMTVHLTFTPALDVGMYNVLNVTAALGLLLYHLRCGPDSQALLWVGLTNGLVGAVGGAVYFLQISKLPSMNHNAWSAFPLTALFSICLAFPQASATWRGRRGLGFLALLNTLWIFFSGSRGGMLIGVFCLIFLLVYLRGFGQKLLAVVVAVGGTIAVFTLFTDQQEYALHRVQKLFDSNRALDSRTSGRSDLALAGWYIFRDHPFGVGTGGFGPAYANLLDNDLSFVGEERQAHSAWVKTLAENGPVGFLILGAYIASFAFTGFRLRKYGFLPLGILVTTVIGSAFFSREFQSKGLWLLAAGFLAVTEYRTLWGAMVFARRQAAADPRVAPPPGLPPISRYGRR